LKIEKIGPVYKKGNRHEIGNYRPISVMSIFLKIFEKIVYNRFVSFIIKFKILKEYHYEFQKNKLAISVYQSFIGNVQEALDRLSFAVGIFFDLTKAYDVIDHDILTCLWS
jgi:hypothetical protein